MSCIAWTGHPPRPLRVVAGKRATMQRRLFAVLLGVGTVTLSASVYLRAGGQATSPERALLDKYCVTCHNQRLKTGGLTLDDVDVANVGRQSGDLGEGRPEASRQSDAAGGHAAPGRGHVQRLPVVPRNRRSIALRRTPIPAAPKRSIVSIASNIATRFAICWRSTSTSAPCCRPTM